MSELPPLVQDKDAVSRPQMSFARRVRRLAAFFDVIASIFLLASAALMLLITALAINGQGEWASVHLVIGGFVIALGVGFTALLLARYHSLGLGWIGAILGLVLANTPLLLALLASWLHFSLKTLLITGICRMTPGMGFYLIVISVIHLIIANIYFITRNRQAVVEQLQHDGAAEGSKKASISFMPKCWEMYACPDAARSKCPNFIDQVNCWKRRRGCLCDHKLSTYLFQGPAARATFQLANPQRLDLNQFADLEHYPAKMREAKPRSWRERRPFCHNCSVFLEHQGYKYRKLNWTFLPISVVLIVVLFPYFHLAYNFAARQMDKLSRHMAQAGHLPDGFYSNASNLVGSPYEYVLLAVFALLLMSYVVEFTDWCLLEWKL